MFSFLKEIYNSMINYFSEKYSKIKKVYNQIYTSNVNKYKYATHHKHSTNLCVKNLVKLKIMYVSVFNTFITLIRYNYELFLSMILSPKKMGDNVLLINYYYGNKWYSIPIQHKMSSATRILKVTTTVSNKEGNTDTLDVTEKIRKYLGPDENFYNQHITPTMIGYNNLTVYKMTDYTLEHKKFNSEDHIVL